MAYQSGNCRKANKGIGKNASTEMEIGVHFKPCSYAMKKALLKATIMAVMEMNNVNNPYINFNGSDLRKSSWA